MAAEKTLDPDVEYALLSGQEKAAMAEEITLTFAYAKAKVVPPVITQAQSPKIGGVGSNGADDSRPPLAAVVNG